MFKWRLLVAEGRKSGHTFSQPDLIIAATGLHHGLTVVSRDTSEFIKARAQVFNPWVENQVFRVQQPRRLLQPSAFRSSSEVCYPFS